MTTTNGWKNKINLTPNNHYQLIINLNFKQMIRRHDALLDEDDYGFSSLEKFRRRNEQKILNKKRAKQRKRAMRNVKSNAGRKIGNRYAIIDPHSYDITRFFDSITQLENYFGIKKIYPRLHRFERYRVSLRATPNIKGFIVVRWKDKEALGLDRDEFEQMLLDKVRGWLIINQFERIRANMEDVDTETQGKLFKYLDKIERMDSYKKLDDE